MLYRVVWTDGYNRETMADTLELDNLGFAAAHLWCQHLRATNSWDGDWWVVRRQDEKLWSGMAEFV
jgi:hypothetical protein